MPIQFGGPGVQPSLGSLTSNTIKLASGECWIIPSGRWCIKSGPYTSTQQYDQVTGIWRTIGAGDTTAVLEAIFSDGGELPARQSDRLSGGRGADQCGDRLHLGSGGHGIGWRFAVASRGRRRDLDHADDHQRRVQLHLSADHRSVLAAQRRVQATATCTISGGIVNAITVTDQGAGYNAPPTVQFVNDPREGVNNIALGTGAAGVTSLTGSGTITALLCIDHGTGGQTAVPTLTFTGGGGASAAATAIMCWSITGLVVSSTTAGSGYAAPVIISATTRRLRRPPTSTPRSRRCWCASGKP